MAHGREMIVVQEAPKSSEAPAPAAAAETPQLSALMTQIAGLEKEVKAIKMMIQGNQNASVGAPAPASEPAKEAKADALPAAKPDATPASVPQSAKQPGPADTKTEATSPNPGPAAAVEASPPAAGNDNPTHLSTGPHAGKLLLVEAGQSLEAFKTEYKLNEEQWAEWQKKSLPAILDLIRAGKLPNNLTDPSWSWVKV